MTTTPRPVSAEEAYPVYPPSCNCTETPCPHIKRSAPDWSALAQSVIAAGAECGLTITDAAARHLAATVVSDHRFDMETERDAARAQAMEYQQNAQEALADLAKGMQAVAALREEVEATALSRNCANEALRKATAECQDLREEVARLKEERESHRWSVANLLSCENNLNDIDFNDLRAELREMGGFPDGHDLQGTSLAFVRDAPPSEIDRLISEVTALRQRAESAEAARHDLDWMTHHIPELTTAKPGDKVAVDIGILSVLLRARDRLAGDGPSAPAVDWRARAEAAEKKMHGVLADWQVMNALLREAWNSMREPAPDNGAPDGPDYELIDRIGAALEGGKS